MGVWVNVPCTHTPIHPHSSMSESEQELLEITRRILAAIHSGEVEKYRDLCSPDLSCFESDVAPYRIEGLDFHLDLMNSMRASGRFESLVRFDMLQPKVQIHGDCAV